MIDTKNPDRVLKNEVAARKYARNQLFFSEEVEIQSCECECGISSCLVFSDGSGELLEIGVCVNCGEELERRFL